MLEGVTELGSTQNAFQDFVKRGILFPYSVGLFEGVLMNFKSII